MSERAQNVLLLIILGILIVLIGLPTAGITLAIITGHLWWLALIVPLVFYFFYYSER